DLEQQRGHQEEVVPAHEDDLDVPPALAKPLQVAGRGHSTEAAAKDHDSGLLRNRHVTPPERLSRFAERGRWRRPRGCPTRAAPCYSRAGRWGPRSGTARHGRAPVPSRRRARRRRRGGFWVGPLAHVAGILLRGAYDQVPEPRVPPYEGRHERVKE